MICELFSHVAVKAKMMKEVIALENAVFLDHPKVLIGDERFKDCRCDVRVVIRSKCVADVMKERAYDVFV